MNIDLKYYLTIFLRRSPIFILLTALFTSIGITVAVLLPPEYEAKAVLLVESEQIPRDLAASTVQTRAAEQLQIIERRLMTRANLLDMANRLGLFRDQVDRGEALSAGEIVEEMRARTTFFASGTNSGRRGPGSATILSIAYRGSTPAQVAEVTNEFVTLVLQENVEIRTEQAGDTLEFFEQEVERLGTELDNRSAQILEFEAKAGVALPANLEFLRERRATFEDTMAARSQKIETLREQRQRLVELFELTGGVQNSGAGLSPLEQRLNAARQNLEDKKLIYSEQNPKLAILIARVEQLEQQAADQQLARSGAAEEQQTEQASRQEQMLDAQLAEIDEQVADLQASIEVLTGQIADIEGSIQQAPVNGVGLSKLQRDFNNVREQYNQAVSRLSAAATGERIELLAKGQRISVIEQAIVPDAPTKPNRPMVALAGMGAGMFLGLAVIVLLELLNRSIRRPAELTSKLGITPLAVLPYLKTDREMFMRRMVLMGIVAFLIIGVPLSVYAVHTLVMPLQTVLEPLLNKVGYSII